MFHIYFKVSQSRKGGEYPKSKAENDRDGNIYETKKLLFSLLQNIFSCSYSDV